MHYILKQAIYIATAVYSGFKRAIMIQGYETKDTAKDCALVTSITNQFRNMQICIVRSYVSCRLILNISRGSNAEKDVFRIINHN
jgi:hypothetical protein